MFSIGIDFGKAFARAVALEGDRDTGDGIVARTTSIPSVVSLADRTVLVGSEATRRATSEPWNTIRNVKRFLGRSISDARVIAEAPSLPFHLEDGLAAGVRFKLEDRTVAPDAVSGAILQRLVAGLASEGRTPTQAVAGVPTWFDA